MEANPRHVPDLSVLVPVYGVERYIADCARSLFAQRDVDAEFVFVDDASPDGSVDRLREVMAEYPAVGERVRILRHARNRGVGAARRTAIEAARSTYICFVDSDDALSDDRALAQLSEEARRTDADLIFGGYCEVSPAGRRRIHTPRPDRDRVLRSLLRQDYRTSNRLWGILIRRALQCFILLRRKGKSHCLQPFGHIRILEHGSVKFPFTQACRDLKIHQAVAWLGVLYPVINGIPLIRDDRLLDKGDMF